MRIFFLVFSLLFNACDREMVSTNNPPINPPFTPTKTISYLALGDSYTIGESVEEAERFPVQFVHQLRDAVDSVAIKDAQIIAKTGWRTDQLQTAIEEADLPDTFDLVSLLIGVNNQFQGRPIETYKTEFTELLNRSIELAGGDKNRVFVLSIPDYAFTPYGQGSNPTFISAGVDNFNAANKEITEMIGVRYFDITPISREGVEKPGLVASDGLHPSGEQYRQWVEVFFSEMKMVVE